jgi:alkylation response protein AidB-like acyl-CoA dehydrogenase
MRFDFSPEQVALRDSVVRLFEARADTVSLRALWETETGREPKLWDGLVDLGLTALLVPEEYDGLGGDEVDLCPVLEEVGRFCVPDAVLEAVLLAPAIISMAGSADQKARWLPALASGEVRATVALSTTPFVPDAHVSDLIVLQRDGALTLYERSEVDIARVKVMDPSRRVFAVTPRAGAGSPLQADGPTLDAIQCRQDVGLAALLGGVSVALLDRTVEYAKIRKQFDRTIGSFQAVKHQLAQADAYAEVARQATRSSFYRTAHHDPRAVDSAVLARVCATEAEFECNRVALQLHGGIGFTWEHDLQFWLKRGKSLEQSYGTLRSALARAGSLGLTQAATNAV